MIFLQVQRIKSHVWYNIIILSFSFWSPKEIFCPQLSFQNEVWCFAMPQYVCVCSSLKSKINHILVSIIFLVVKMFILLLSAHFNVYKRSKKSLKKKRKKCWKESEQQKITVENKDHVERASLCILFYHFGCHYSDFSALFTWNMHFTIASLFLSLSLYMSVLFSDCLCLSLSFSLSYKLSLLFHPVVLFIVWFHFSLIQCVIHEWLHFFVHAYTNERDDNIMMYKTQESEQVLDFFEVIMTTEWMNKWRKKKVNWFNLKEHYRRWQW